jgi:hypothetical protein
MAKVMLPAQHTSRAGQYKRKELHPSLFVNTNSEFIKNLFMAISSQPGINIGSAYKKSEIKDKCVEMTLINYGYWN